jgi:hypothetical protein
MGCEDSTTLEMSKPSAATKVSRTYRKTAALPHRPKTWMRHSETPARAIRWAPVTRGLWPVMNTSAGVPDATAAALKAAMTLCLLTWLPPASVTK